MANDTPNTSHPDGQPGPPDIPPSPPAAAEPGTGARIRRRRAAPPPTGTIDFFTQAAPHLPEPIPPPEAPPESAREPQPAPEPATTTAPEPTTPDEASIPQEVMALVRELRRLHAWTPDSTETRTTLQALVASAFEASIPAIRTLLAPLLETQQRAVTTLESLIRDAADEAMRRARSTEATLAAAEQRAAAISTQLTQTTATLDDWLSRTNADFAKRMAEPWYRRALPGLAASAACGFAMILLLTLLRPGWTLTTQQRDALAVGESVTRVYLSATPAHQAEMRRVNRWRTPDPPDTTTTAPQRKP